MLDDNEVITVFENEDLIFSLKTGRLISKSNRISSFFGGVFFSKISSLDEYEELIGDYSSLGYISRVGRLTDCEDDNLEFSLKWNGKVFFVNERVWKDQMNDTLHVYIFIENPDNVFELSEKFLLEIVDKMSLPSIVFNKDFSRALMANSLILDLFQLPLSQLVKGFVIQDLFVKRSVFSEILSWLKDESKNRISIEGKLYLKNIQGNWFNLRFYKVRMDEEDCVVCFLIDINKFKSGEVNMQRTNELLSNMIEVQKHFLAQESGAKPYQLLLDNILGVIEAKLGFIGEVAFDHQGKQVLKIHAATDISQDGPEASRLYQKYLKDDFLFRHFDNLFGACIKEAEIILENNPPQNPHTKGKYIPGHPHIENFLGIPILKGERVVGLIGLGNKSGGFVESDVTELQPFVSTYSVIIEAFNFEVEKIKYEKDALEKAMLLSKVADASPDLIVMMNENSELEYISNATEKFLEKGIKPTGIHRKIKLLLKKTYSEKYRVNKDFYRSRQKVKVSAKEGLWLESVVSVLKENNRTKLFAIIRDVSVQAQIEENLKLSLNKEREFNSFVGDFMNTVSHEFKTPLATIMSSLELANHYLTSISPDSGKEKVMQHFRKIQAEVNNLHHLVSQSLDYDRFAGKVAALKKEPVSFREFIEDCVRKHRFQSKIEFVSDLDYNFEVSLDKFLIETSLINLLENAIKYGGKSKPVLRLQTNETKFGFEVSDKGIGIKKEELPYVFTPFYRGSNANGIEGTGFGLVAVKNFVGLHEGEVFIESESGKGTLVKVWFPQ